MNHLVIITDGDENALWSIEFGLPSAVGSKNFSSVLAFLSELGENDSSWDFKSTATFGKSFSDGAAIVRELSFTQKWELKNELGLQKE